MKVLMFGWEFPPHISGGLGTACYYMTKQLSESGDINITLVLPKTYGDEDQSIGKIISAESVDIGKRAGRYAYIEGYLTQWEKEALFSAYTTPETYSKIIQKLVAMKLPGLKNPVANKLCFSGRYGATLFDEIRGYSEIGSAIGSSEDFDIIHAHDWLTFPAGIAAKRISGKPFIAHIHATEMARSGEYNYNSNIYHIERQGMHAADKVIAVSDYTRNIVIHKYGVPPGKVITVHNGVNVKQNHFPFNKNNLSGRIVTYLGRITMQKGPDYFINAAYNVLQKLDDVYFVMAGTGDLLEKMIQRVTQLNISNRFFFTGFLKGDEVLQMYSLSDLYVMPSVSEPFGISPLEAVASGIPVIISKQSGVSEILNYAIKVDFWDINAMSDAIYGMLQYSALSKVLKNNGINEIPNFHWRHSVNKIRRIYEEMANGSFAKSA